MGAGGRLYRRRPSLPPYGRRSRKKASSRAAPSAARTPATSSHR